MRSDMAKVIVERPRFGSRMPSKGKGYHRRFARCDWDSQPKREGMKVRSGGGKQLNEHLAPLRRYLLQQLGKRWDAIFADICRYLDRNSAVQDHVRDHVEDYVATCVLVNEGRLYHGNGCRAGWPLYTECYVCPRTGILKKNPNYRRQHARQSLQVRFLEDRNALVRMRDRWYVITWARMPASDCTFPYPSRWDALLEENVTRDRVERLYGRAIHATTARRATKREVRHHVNSYPHTNRVR